MQPQDPLGIYATNRTEWVIADLAAHAYSMRTVALYDTLGKDAGLCLFVFEMKKKGMIKMKKTGKMNEKER